MSDRKLIGVLRSEVLARRRALRFGWSRRKDHDAMNRALMACEQFVASYPGASDATVQRWCAEHRDHVMRVVIGSRVSVLQQLIG